MNRARLPQINSVSSSFEPIRRNSILLGEDSFLDEHQKPIRIGGIASPLSLSKSKLRIDGDFHLEGKLANPLLETEFKYLELRAEENIRFTSAYASGHLDLFVFGGTPYFTASGGNYYFVTAETGVFNFGNTGNISGFTFDTVNTKFSISDPDDTGDNFSITVDTHGATTLASVDDDAAAAHLTLDPDGDLIFSGCDIKIDATQKLYLDGGGDSYIYEEAADTVTIVAGGTSMIQISETAIGNYVRFESCGVGFDQIEPTYNASNTTVSFDAGNKQFLTFGSGNITTIKLGFPSASGNFTLILKQDGTGSRTITNWNAYDIAGSAAAGSSTVKWAGGSAPTLTTDANHVDILSFYWDADNEIAYGVATLDFQF